MYIDLEVALACQMRANYIETGDVNLTHRDVAIQLAALDKAPRGWDPNSAQRRKLEEASARWAGLSDNQLALIERLRSHATTLERAYHG